MSNQNPWQSTVQDSTEVQNSAGAQNSLEAQNAESTLAQASNPWSTAGNDSPPDEGNNAPADNPWGSTANEAEDTGDPSQGGGTDWLNQEVTIATPSNSFSDPFVQPWLPLQESIEQFVDWFVPLFRPFFSAIKAPIDTTLTTIETTLSSVHPAFVIIAFGLLAWQLAGRGLAIGSMLSFVAIGAIGVWEEAMVTLSLVITSVLFCILIGIPTGIWMARNDMANRITRPLLDAMQTTPAFVYLVPIVMLFGIGNVPGVIVTIIFAVPPVIRLTNLGIRQVSENLIEAANSFGASRSQLLFKVQLPLAMPTIMAGINQTLMLSLSMVVIASMIAVGGLGLMVMRGIGRLDIGLATIGGIGIVILAIVLDRMTQALGRDARERGTRNWYDSGPVALVYRCFKGKPSSAKSQSTKSQNAKS